MTRQAGAGGLCPYCGEPYHTRHWCLREPANWERMHAWMQAHAEGGVIISRWQYIAIAKSEGLPSATTLEKQLAGVWADVAKAFGLAAGEMRGVGNQISRLDEARYHYDVHRDDVPDEGLAVLPTPRRDTWYSVTTGRWHEGQAWVLR